LAIFGWISDVRGPPARWDLRLSGWTLCNVQCTQGDARLTASECRHVLLVDAGGLAQAERLRLAAADRAPWRLLLLAVDEAVERAELIDAGCGEALPAGTGLRELDVRARRMANLFQCLPRWRTAGPLLLDLFHRDGRIGRRWLGLHPREFSLLWRLAARPGERVTRRQLLQDVWRLDHDPETNSLEVHVSRLRGKLARLGCVSLIETVPEGGYRLTASASHPPLVAACCTDFSAAASVRADEEASPVP
jgi:DNA-binding response OmpR family regulator